MRNQQLFPHLKTEGKGGLAGDRCLRPPNSWLTFLHPLITGPVLALFLLAGLQVVSRAQGDTLTVLITAAHTGDRAGAPVTALVTVLDDQGLPVAGLTPANFEIGRTNGANGQVPTEVTADTGLPVALVLALDVSLDQAGDLAKIKEAALALIDTLSPQDYVTLITFDHQVRELFQGPAADREALQQLIAGLQSRGEQTAFYQAAHRAVEVLDRSRTPVPARPAIVILTNLGNNIDTTAAVRAQKEVARSELPLHIVSFGRRARVDQLATLARQTGGQFFDLPDIEALPVTLRRVGVLIRYGYQVTFHPDPTAGTSRPYHFSIRVTTPQGKTGQAETTVLLEPAPPRLVLSGLQNLILGQRLVVTAEVTGPAPATSVSYQVDNGPVHVVSSPPYRFTWHDPAAGAGEHTLTVTVVDRAGNRAVTRTTFEVSRPVLVPVTQVEWGDTVTLAAQIDHPATVTTVRFHLEEILIAALKTAPYHLDFGPDSPGYPPRPETQARYRLITRITDRSGRITRDERILEFLEPAGPPAAGRTGPLAGGLLLLAGNFFLLPLLLLVWGMGYRRRQKSLQTEARLTLRNRGNLPTPFRVTVSNPEAAELLLFQLKKGRTKPVLSGLPAPDGVESKWTGAFNPTLPVPDLDPAPVRRAPGRTSSGCLAGLIEGLDIFSGIPFIGSPFRIMVGQLRRGQSETNRLIRMPKQILEPARRLHSRMPVSSGPAPRETASPVPAVPPDVATKAVSPPAAENRPAPAIGWQSRLTVETLPVAPGQSLVLELWLRPVSLPACARCYPVRLATRPAEAVEGAEFSEDRVTEAQVRLQGVPGWYRLYPMLATRALLLMLVVDLVWLAGWLVLLYR